MLPDKIVPKFENPIIIRLSKDINDSYMLFPYRDEKLPIKNGVLIGSDIYYGFILIYEQGDKLSKVKYCTQMPIDGIEVKENTVRVYEKEKYKPWLFTPTGKLVSGAEWMHRQSEIDYLQKECGAMTDEDINQLNETSVRRHI